MKHWQKKIYKLTRKPIAFTLLFFVSSDNSKKGEYLDFTNFSTRNTERTFIYDNYIKTEHPENGFNYDKNRTNFSQNWINDLFDKHYHFDTMQTDHWFITIIIALFLFIGCLVFTAAFTLYERKLIGLFQRREGPDKVGIEGIGQPFADGLKLIAKETLIPRQTPAPGIFYLAPIISLSISLTIWSLIPISTAGALVNSNISVLLALGVSSIGAYGVIYAGWASNNKYALLGSLRAVAQFISYEVILSLIFIPSLAIVQSIDFNAIIEFQHNYGWFSYQIPLAIVFIIVILAETNRTPFDLPEAEAELVSGFNVEYSSLLFSMFFLAEYSSIGFISTLFVIFFLGGWSNNPFGLFDNSVFYSKKMSIVEDRGHSTHALYEIFFLVDKEDPSELQISELPEVPGLVRPGVMYSIDSSEDFTKMVVPYFSFTDINFVNLKLFYDFSSFSTYYGGRSLTNSLYWMAGHSYKKLIECYSFTDLSYVTASAFFTIKIVITTTIFIFVRAALPRKRFDQLISLCWKYLFPLTLILVIWSVSIYIVSFIWFNSINIPVQKTSIDKTQAVFTTIESLQEFIDLTAKRHFEKYAEFYELLAEAGRPEIAEQYREICRSLLTEGQLPKRFEDVKNDLNVVGEIMVYVDKLLNEAYTEGKAINKNPDAATEEIVNSFRKIKELSTKVSDSFEQARKTK